MGRDLMKVIAHRGGLRGEFQNSPEGVRLAAMHQADGVELDVVMGADGVFRCGHGWGRRSLLADCLKELGAGMELMVHLKGRYAQGDLRRLVDQLAGKVSLERVMFASHRGRVLDALSVIIPEDRLARFGWVPALLALRSSRRWRWCLVNQLVLTRPLVAALHRMGYRVMASCVWEFRSRKEIERLGVDGMFVNLFD
jgi:glycerophosphoryl diester phosphodiesterase